MPQQSDISPTALLSKKVLSYTAYFRHSVFCCRSLFSQEQAVQSEMGVSSSLHESPYRSPKPFHAMQTFRKDHIQKHNIRATA